MEGKSASYWRNAIEKRKNPEKKEREKYYYRNGYANASGKVKSKRKMDECRAEW
jgi:hypothetical protein